MSDNLREHKSIASSRASRVEIFSPVRIAVSNETIASSRVSRAKREAHIESFPEVAQGLLRSLKVGCIGCSIESSKRRYSKCEIRPCSYHSIHWLANDRLVCDLITIELSWCGCGCRCRCRCGGDKLNVVYHQNFERKIWREGRCPLNPVPPRTVIPKFLRKTPVDLCPQKSTPKEINLLNLHLFIRQNLSHLPERSKYPLYHKKSWYPLLRLGISSRLVP